MHQKIGKIQKIECCMFSDKANRVFKTKKRNKARIQVVKANNILSGRAQRQKASPDGQFCCDPEDLTSIGSSSRRPLDSSS